MSIRLEMLQVARVAPKLLGDSTDLVRQFIRSQFNPDGSGRDRDGEPDIYYTVFCLESALALQMPDCATATRGYLQSMGDGEDLDFIHLCCLIRAWACVGMPNTSPLWRRNVRDRIATFRTADGGYAIDPRGPGTAYGCFLGLAAHQDLREPLPAPEGLVTCLDSLRTKDGGWSNVATIQGRATGGATLATAAATTVLRHLNTPIPEEVEPWLRAQAHPQGGFRAAPDAPIPDLLTTATVLHTLSGLGADLTSLQEPCLDLVDSLWTNAGGFHGHWADDHLDAEYTYYALLALGHLAL